MHYIYNRCTNKEEFTNMNKAKIIVLNDFREISVGKKGNFKLYVIISSEVVELGPV